MPRLLGWVDLADFALLAADWMAAGPSLVGDIAANDAVDADDLALFVQYWLTECP